jgi:hypothetical protein
MKLINSIPAFLVPMVLGDTKPNYDSANKSVTFKGGADQIFTDKQREALFGERKSAGRGRGRGNERGLNKSITKWPWSVADDGYVINYWIDTAT